jgi:hypothetical protein
MASPPARTPPFDTLGNLQRPSCDHFASLVCSSTTTLISPTCPRPVRAQSVDRRRGVQFCSRTRRRHGARALHGNDGRPCGRAASSSAPTVELAEGTWWSGPASPTLRRVAVPVMSFTQENDSPAYGVGFPRFEDSRSPALTALTARQFCPIWHIRCTTRGRTHPVQLLKSPLSSRKCQGGSEEPPPATGTLYRSQQRFRSPRVGAGPDPHRRLFPPEGATRDAGARLVEVAVPLVQ